MSSMGACNLGTNAGKGCSPAADRREAATGASGGAGAVEIVAGSVIWGEAAMTGAAGALAWAANISGGSLPRSEGSGYVKTSSRDEDAIMDYVKSVFPQKLRLLQQLVMDGSP